MSDGGHGTRACVREYGCAHMYTCREAHVQRGNIAGQAYTFTYANTRKEKHAGMRREKTREKERGRNGQGDMPPTLLNNMARKIKQRQVHAYTYVSPCMHPHVYTIYVYVCAHPLRHNCTVAINNYDGRRQPRAFSATYRAR